MPPRSSKSVSDAAATHLRLVEAERAAVVARIDLRSAAIGVAASNLRSQAIEELRRHVEAYLLACEANGSASARLEQAVLDAAAALPLTAPRSHVLQGLARALRTHRLARTAVVRARARHAAVVRAAGG